MLQFSLLSQFTWKGNKTYQLLLNNNKIYGIYLPKYTDINKLYSGIATWILGIISYIVFSFLLELLITDKISLTPSLSFKILDFVIFIAYISIFANIIGKIPPLKNIIRTKHKEIDLKKTEVIEKSNQLIEKPEDTNFLKLNKHIFIINLDDIQNTDMTIRYGLEYWLSVVFYELLIYSQTSYTDIGQLRIILKDGRYKYFALAENNFYKLKECNDVIREHKVKKDN